MGLLRSPLSREDRAAQKGEISTQHGRSPDSEPSCRKNRKNQQSLILEMGWKTAHCRRAGTTTRAVRARKTWGQGQELSQHSPSQLSCSPG